MSPNFRDSITSILVSEASTSIMKSLERSGCFKMGASVNVSLRHWTAWTAEWFHCNFLGPLLSMVVKGVAIELIKAVEPQEPL